MGTCMAATNGSLTGQELVAWVIANPEGFYFTPIEFSDGELLELVGSILRTINYGGNDPSTPEHTDRAWRASLWIGENRPSIAMEAMHAVLYSGYESMETFPHFARLEAIEDYLGHRAASESGDAPLKYPNLWGALLEARAGMNK